ncbi:MAG: hypothetical protein N4A72_17850 [Bacteroidales bacterium]|jgi:hypothetical protein|nr:hypothetical protein [Bacteroidales bacterium]
MKKLFVVFIFIVIGLCAAAQPTLTFSKNAYKPGLASKMAMIDYIEPGDSGTNVLWDFSKLALYDTVDTKMDTINYYYKGWFLGEVKLELKEFNYSFFFDISRDSILNVGYAYSRSDSVVRYTDPILKLCFPLIYGIEKRGPINGKYYEQGLTAGVIEGDYMFKSDAWGKLILPDGQEFENVLRIKSVRNIKMKGEKRSFQHRNVSYKWYSPYVRYPLLSISNTDMVDGERVRQQKRGMYQLDIKRDTSEIDPRLKQFYALADIYIEYELEEDCIVKGKLIDEWGQVHQVLFEEYQIAGSYDKTIKRSHIPEELIDGSLVIEMLDQEYEKFEEKIIKLF